MKKYSIIFSMILLTLLSYAQPVTLLDTHHNDVTNSSYKVYGDMLATDTSHIYTILNSSIIGDKEVSVTKYNISKCAGTQNLFCWAQCYTPAITDESPFLSPHRLTLTPGDTNNSFSSYHIPEGNTGNAIYRYVWSVKGEVDTAFVDIEFVVDGTCTEVSINEKITNRLKITPNPANGIIRISNSEIVGDYDILITDVLGNAVKDFQTSNAELNMNVSHLSNGIYFVKIVQENNIMSIKKLVIVK